MVTVPDQRFEAAQLRIRLQPRAARHDLRRREGIHRQDVGVGLHRAAAAEAPPGDAGAVQDQALQRPAPGELHPQRPQVPDPGLEPGLAARGPEQEPPVPGAMPPGGALGVRAVEMGRSRDQLLAEEVPRRVQRAARPVRADPRPEAGAPGAGGAFAHHPSPLLRGVARGVVLEAAAARRPRLEHQPGPAHEVQASQAEHGGDAAPPPVVELRRPLVRKDAEVDGT